jgi:hypothetical protein
LKLGAGDHYGARFSCQERKRIRLWIESGATYPGTYAALGSGMSLVEFPNETIKRRCATCHLAADVQPYSGMSQGDLYQFGKLDPPQALVSGFADYNLVIRLAYLKFQEAPPHQALCNLSKPEQSLLVRAPMARAAGGLELCGLPVFADAMDPDYLTLLSAIRVAAKRLDQQKRFDMPGFQPNAYYVRQMQHYGVLPDPIPDTPIDPYATDRAYWELLEDQVAGQPAEPTTFRSAVPTTTAGRPGE